jgi:hypothetical protein
MKTTYNDENRVAVLNSGQIIYAVHKSTQCLGEVCPIHKPSNHDLINAPLTFDPMVGSFFREIGGELVVDPDDYALNTQGEVIVRNAITCLGCQDTIESTHRHHFVTCSCGKSSVDGGHAYLRRVGGNWVDASVIAKK